MEGSLDKSASHSTSTAGSASSRTLRWGCAVTLLSAVFAAGCTSSGGSTPDGPRYMQPDVGKPPQQTDFFGNSLRP